MSAYTKGPWKVSNEVAHRVIDDYATIAHCNVSSRDSFEAHANARLIAASPELLEALKGVMAGTYRAEQHKDCKDCNFKRALAAIAKAEGK